jgi:hypothetical protein
MTIIIVGFLCAVIGACLGVLTLGAVDKHREPQQ